MSASTSSASATWFEYPIRVQPHHTDYGGVVWHGTYVAWLETARVECLRAAKAPFEALIAQGYDLPVVRLDLRYRQPLQLGQSAVVRTRLEPIQGIRLNWVYEMRAVDEAKAMDASSAIALTGQVTLVTVDVEKRKVVRRIPKETLAIVDKVATYFNEGHLNVGSNVGKRVAD